MKTSRLKVLIPIFALVLCGAVVLFERYGVKYNPSKSTTIDLNKVYTEDVNPEKECMFLFSETEGDEYGQEVETVLEGMKIPFAKYSVEDTTFVEELNQYQTLVFAFQDWTSIDEDLPDIMEWVHAGGSILVTETPYLNEAFQGVSKELGIEGFRGSYVGISGVRFDRECMIGAKAGDVFYFDGEDAEKIEVTLDVELSESTQRYISSENGEYPLLWKNESGNGSVVMMNYSTIARAQRGFFATAYSLLKDACIYPIINGSAFYLDDFPSPVPGGDGAYIERDYGIDIAAFYSTVWWPTVLEWEKKYGIKHTGMIIEVYSDTVEAPFERNKLTTQFVTYGNMLLNSGGELGFHGYNHMPLCVKGTDDDMQFGDYKLWASAQDIQQACSELSQFAENLFPQSVMQVYVPPSNIMAQDGKEALLQACPEIRILASIYLPSEDSPEYLQEFEVEANGIIDTPRITSGSTIDDYQKITELGELNFHYVQSHFMHPDDALDVDRGAELGWKTLSGEFEKYLDWVYSSAPNIRNLTGSGMGLAVQQYDYISMERRMDGNTLNVKLGGFSDEAYFMLRNNGKEIVGTKGCTLEQINAEQYIVHATASELCVIFGE